MILLAAGRPTPSSKGMASGLASAVIVAAVSLLVARLARAGGKRSTLFLLPALMFTVASIAMMFWNTLTGEAGWLDCVAGLTPFLVGFGIPVFLLLLVCHELRKRTLNDRQCFKRIASTTGLAVCFRTPRRSP